MRAVIGLDWGTSRLRAYLMDPLGHVVERRTSDDGAIGLDVAGFDAVLVRIAGDWVRREPDAALVACGMVGARGGWAEAGYVELPAGLDAIRDARLSVATSLGVRLEIVGGIKTGEPDVLRGEETHALGSGISDGWLCMPGTHSKWLRLEGGVIRSFRTWFTGELYQLLVDHGSIAKALGPTQAADGHVLDAQAFEAGVASAAAGGPWLHQLFGFRARVVGAGAPGPAERARLSGWLVGTELVQALAQPLEDAAPLALIGNAMIGDWYARALAVLAARDSRYAGLDFLRPDPDCAARGLFRIAAGT
jgi:2-dehydro-3-deoxygalactonokinase